MSRKLEDYDAKRNFETTPEPPGETASTEAGRLYVIQKHAATRLHYDLRLEHEGVLLSWAVPKGPSLDVKQRRLAVRVEDHPVEYGSFEGTIPEGEYGGGTVMVWDRGIWSPHGDIAESLAAGKLVFDLAGQKLSGRFGLIHTGARKSGREQNQWLLIKEKDAFARPSEEYDVTQALPDSAASDRTIEEIAEADTADDGTDEDDDETELPAVPDDLRPQLATLVDRIPVGDEWVHEIKYDGYRLLLVVAGGRARALTREGHDWSERFPGLVSAAAALPIGDAVIDAEAVALSDRGVPDFGALQQALYSRRSDDVVAYCFDLLFAEGRDLRPQPLLERKAALEAILARQSPATSVRLRYADHIADPSDDMLERACALGAEGIVSKRADAPYRAGRGRTWLKAKCVLRQEFVVVGYTAPRGSRTGFGALLLAYYGEDGRLAYAGRVGSGFSDRDLQEVSRALVPLVQDGPALESPASLPKNVTWVEPRLVAEVAYAEWTASGHLRHPSFIGLRQDRDPASIGREMTTPIVCGVAITHPERLMIPEGPTKLALARYYDAVAPHVMRHVGGRPLTLLRCPDGAAGTCFWQRHIEEGTLPHVVSQGILDREYVAVDETAGLIELIQYLTVEFHVWGARLEKPDRPDRLVFDLDPGSGITWDDVRAAALVVREILGRHGLESFVKTSGGAGLHVLSPIVPNVPVREVAAVTKALAQEVVASGADILTIDPRKEHRHGRIFVDWHRNGAAQSTVGAYVVRARSGGPVSTPIAWDELRTGVDPSSFTTEVVLARLRATGDPWENLDAASQHLPQEALDV